MTSEQPEAGCFVYITLPGQTTAVTAGRFVIEVDRHGQPLGKFVYGKSYLARPNRVAIDPVELKLVGHTVTTTRLNGLFGALRDAAPDHWGRRVIERHAGKPHLTDLDYLLLAPDDRAGALSFGLGPVPPPPQRHFNRTLDLARLQGIADRLIAEDETPEAPPPTGPDAEQIEELLLLGTSMGGARPKTVVEDEDGLWVAKFSRGPDRDRWNDPMVEHAMLTLAQDCGVTCATSRLTRAGNRDVLLVKRFDRHRTAGGYLRCRMVSGLTVMGAEEAPDRRPNWSYLILADELRRICKQKTRELPQLFRRICFNALISNVDDHPRNHAIVAKDDEWGLSPAYDLTPTPLIAQGRRDLALDCGTWGRYANRNNLLSQCEHFFVPREEAERIVDGMAEQVRASWYPTARRVGVSERDCETIRNAFVYEGWDLDLVSSPIIR